MENQSSLSKRCVREKDPQKEYSSTSPVTSAASGVSCIAPRVSSTPNTTTQGVSFTCKGARGRRKVGVSYSGSSLAFGSTDDATPARPSSPAATPPVDLEPPKRFGSINAIPVNSLRTHGRVVMSSLSPQPSPLSPTRSDVKKLATPPGSIISLPTISDSIPSQNRLLSLLPAPSLPRSPVSPPSNLRLNPHVPSFVPRNRKVVIKNAASVEVTVEGPWAQTLSRDISAPLPPAPAPAVRALRKPVQIESELQSFQRKEVEKCLREEQKKRQTWMEEDGPESKTSSTSTASNDHSETLDSTVAHMQDEVHLDYDGTALTNTATPELSDTHSPVGHASGTARSVTGLNSVEYPDGVQRPRIELNRNLKQGKFRYDRDFLLQFMPECKEKPNFLFPLAAFGLDPSVLHSAVSRGGSGRWGGSSPMSSPSSATPRQTSVGANAPNPQSVDLKVPTQVLQARDDQIPPSSVSSRFVLSNKDDSSRKPLVGNRTRSKRGLKRVDRPTPCQSSPLGSSVFVPDITTSQAIAPNDVATNSLPPVEHSGTPSVPEEEKTAEETGALICTHCGAEPLDPIVTTCKHLFCHRCIMAELAKNMCCPACQSIVLLRLNSR